MSSADTKQPAPTPDTKTPAALPQGVEADSTKPTANTEDKLKSQQTAEIKEVNLNEKNEEKIKGYKLKHGDYRVIVKILEANDLVPRVDDGIKIFTNKDGTANPYVSVNILDRIKRTTTKKKTLNPIFNEQFYFEFKDLIMSQLEEASIIFRVMDYNMVGSDTLIGTFEVDLTTVYFNLNHEYYQTTLLLYDPEDKDVQTSGMLKVNIEVLGPNDEPNVHNVITEVKPDASKDNILKPARIRPVGHNIEVNLFRAEHLPVLDFTLKGIDAFAVVKYAGVVKATKVITSFSPEWNQNIKLATMLPNQSKSVNVEVWDYDLLGKNDLVGAFKVDFKLFRDTFLQPRWVNLYGPPVSATESDVAEPMKLYGYDIGSAYRGRVLYSIGSYNERDPRTAVTDYKFSFPDNPEPASPERSYILRVDLYEAQEMPERRGCRITVCCGPYKMTNIKLPIVNGRSRLYQQMPDMKMILPVNPEEIPDIFFYFSDKDKESRRHSYARYKFTDFLNPKKNMPITAIKLKEDKSLNLVTDDEFPGFLFAKIAVYSNIPPERPILKSPVEDFRNYQLRVFIYVARDLPPADIEGTADPFVVVRCGGKVARTSVLKKTLNPGWYETIKLDVSLPPFERREVPEGISLLVYDSDAHDNPESKKELLGRAWVRLGDKKRYFVHGDNRVQINYQKPIWKNIIYDATDSYQGKILISYALIDAEKKNMIPEEKIEPEQSPYKIHLFLVGIRNLNPDELAVLKPQQVSVTFDVSGDEYLEDETEKVLVKNNNANLNLYKPLKIGVPYSEALTPLLDVHLNGWKRGSKNSKMLGYASINLRTALKEFYEMVDRGEDPAQYVTELDDDEEAASAKGQTEGNLGEDDKEKEKLMVEHLYQKKKDPTSINDIQVGMAKAFQAQMTAPKTEKERQQRLEEEQQKKIRAQVERDMKAYQESLRKKKEKQKRQFLFAGLGTDIEKEMKGQKAPKEEEHKPALSFLKDAFNMHTEESAQAKGPEKKVVKESDLKTFRIEREHEFDISLVEDKFLEIGNVELEMKPDLTKGDFTMPNRGQVAKKGLFEKFQALFAKEVIEYEEYDTDVEEQLDVIPPWIMKRETKDNELEDFIGENQEIKTIPIKEGRTRGQASFLKFDAPSGLRTIAYLKAIFLEGEGKAIDDKVEEYRALMQPQKFFCRVYILEGVNITRPGHPNKKPDSYLVVKIGDEVRKEMTSLRMETTRPDYFVRYDFAIELPGSPGVEIEVWHKNSLLADEFLGSTTIDLEGRHFNTNWRNYEKKPIEYRSLTNANEKGTYGRLGLWVDLEPATLKIPIYEISPVERLDCELRVIVWEAKEFEHNDTLTGSSDLYIRGGLGSQFNETDTHWRARAKATYNWRWKFKMTWPLGRDDYKGDMFKVQLYDRDLVTSNTMIGETEISLNRHKMLDKVYKRRMPVRMMMKYKNKKGEYLKTDQIWYDVFHPTRLDQNGEKVSVGKILLSFELMPTEEAEKRPNSNGRDQPNNFPALPEPVGRFTFDILSPLKTLKEILGPRLYRIICCSICIIFALVVGVLFGYFILTSALGARLAK